MNQMLTATQIAGFAGAGLAGAAYIPQISHLIKARCAAGISRLAFQAWLLASALTTAHAIAIHAAAFIMLGTIQIAATALITLYTTRYKNTPCPLHPPRHPTAKSEVLHACTSLAGTPHSHAVTKLQATHLKETT